MESTGTSLPVYVGVDVSLERLDVGLWPSGEVFRETNDTRGIRRLAKRIAKISPRLVVLESTGKLEAALALELHERELPYRIVNPRQVRDFARAMGELAKTDRIPRRTLPVPGSHVYMTDTARLSPSII